MSAFDNILGKAEELAVEHKSQVEQAVDKATDLVDGQTGHKYGSQLDEVDKAVGHALDERSIGH